MDYDEVKCFHGNRDHYNGLLVKTYKEICKNDEEFETRLQASLLAWQQEGLRAISLKIELRQSSYIPIAVKHGFVFHHAQPTYVWMVRWLPTDEPNIMPEYANHYVGVGGFVVNDRNEVLVIQEKYGGLLGSKSHWKLPGGLANTGEDLRETAQREVMEETGIESEFVSLLCFRQKHDYKFGRSDLYFICIMKAKTLDIRPCPNEVKACQWMKIEDFASHPDVTDTNRFIIKSYMESLKHEHHIVPTDVLDYRRKITQPIYSIKAQTDSTRDTVTQE